MLDIGHIRQARPGEAQALRRLQELSLRMLSRGFYSASVIEAFITHVGTMDEFLVSEGTYYVLQVGDGVAACGGWSRRKPGYDRASTHCPQARDRSCPVLRSVYVHPQLARRGLGRRVVEHAERTAFECGHSEMELTATLSGVPFYRSLGYEGDESVLLQLTAEARFPAVRMFKTLSHPRTTAAVTTQDSRPCVATTSSAADTN